MTSKKLPTLFDFEKSFDTWLVGYSRLFDEIDLLHENFTACKFPAYDLIKHDDGAVDITLAVAGYSVEDLTVETEGDKLHVRGEKVVKEEDESALCTHKGIATRQFERTFPIAGVYKIDNVELDNGLLSIHIKRNLDQAETVTHEIVTK